mmetsp:Transcript_52401/g.122668  ORF Transcript_52401/g.122668 Transcript_52401/m.122668 type:complete len:314 (+) Transcript_52401:209-1150(+)
MDLLGETSDDLRRRFSNSLSLCSSLASSAASSDCFRPSSKSSWTIDDGCSSPLPLSGRLRRASLNNKSKGVLPEASMAQVFARATTNSRITSIALELCCGSSGNLAICLHAMCSKVCLCPSSVRTPTSKCALSPALTRPGSSCSTCSQSSSCVIFQSAASPLRTLSSYFCLSTSRETLVSYCSNRASARCTSLCNDKEAVLGASEILASSDLAWSAAALRASPSAPLNASTIAAAASARATSVARNRSATSAAASNSLFRLHCSALACCSARRVLDSSSSTCFCMSHSVSSGLVFTSTKVGGSSLSFHALTGT